MNHTKIDQTPLFVFFLILIIASGIIEALIITKNMEVLYPVLMWLPALAAFAATGWKIKKSKEKFALSDFFRRRGLRCGKLAGRWEQLHH